MKTKKTEATLPRPDPGDGYRLSSWRYDAPLRYFCAFVWKPDVLPGRQSAVKAQVTIDERDLIRADFKELVRVKVEAAKIACEYLVRERNAQRPA